MPTISLSAFLTQLIAIAKDDTLKTVLPTIAAFVTNISSNTSSANIVAQLGVLEAALIGDLPDDEQAIVKDVSAILLAEVQALEAEAAAGAGTTGTTPPASEKA